MANYNLVINSKFQPFSFERYLQPVQIYNTAYREVGDAIGELATKASVWERLANDQRDQEVYEQYKAYADDLKAQADRLAKEGLTAVNRKSVMDMKTRYGNEIVPIELAYEARQKQAEEQQKIYNENPYARFSRIAYDTKLADYIRNPQLGYETQYGNLITKRVADAVKNYADTMIRSGNWASTASGQLLERIVTTGLTPEDVQTIMNNKEAFPEIQQLIDNVIESSGVRNWSNKKVAEEFEKLAYEGVFAGMGKQSIDTQKDADYLNDYEEWKWNKERAEAEGQGGEEELEGESVYFPEFELSTENKDTDFIDIAGLTSTENLLETDATRQIDSQIAQLEEENERLNADYTDQNARMASGYMMSNRQVNTAVMNMLNIKKQNLESKLRSMKQELEEASDNNTRSSLTENIKRTEEDILDIKAQMSGLADRTAQRSSIRGKIQQLKNEKQSIQNTLNKYKEKYSHLSVDPTTAIQLGIALDKEQSLSSQNANLFTLGDDNNATSHILSTALRAARSASNTEIYKVEDNGSLSLLDKDDLPKSEDIDNLDLVITNRGFMYTDSNGDKYLIKSTKDTSRRAKEVESIDKYLTDFSNSKEKVYDVGDDEDGGNIFINGRLYNEKAIAKFIIQNKEDGVVEEIAQGTLAATFTQKNGDRIKVVVYDANSNNPKLAYTSMYDVLSGSPAKAETMRKYRSYIGIRLHEDWVNRKPSSTLPKEESLIIQ